MSNRLDQDREGRLTPPRVKHALSEFEKLHLQILEVDDTSIRFLWKDDIVIYYPYSGWATGKSITDGRGLQNLLNQLK